MTGAKISGRRTSDGRYALIYNPNVDDDHRWPLAIVTGDDGVLFDNMLCVQGEVPPRRFAGRYKDFGSQYNRCVEEGNGNTPGTDLWVTYSMNKEDIWVSRIPVPVRQRVTGPGPRHVRRPRSRRTRDDWNIYSPRWAPVAIVDFPSATNKSLELQDKDPYDYARAVRVFPETKSATVHFRVHAGQNQQRPPGNRADRSLRLPAGALIFADDGQIKILNGGEASRARSVQAGQVVRRWPQSRRGERPLRRLSRRQAGRSSAAGSRSTSKASSGFRSARELTATSRRSRPRPTHSRSHLVRTRTFRSRSRSITLTT